MTGYLSLMCPEHEIPRRPPGTYDVQFSENFLHRADDRDALLDSIETCMTTSSMLLVSEPIGQPGVEAAEAEDIVGFLCSKLLARHRTRPDPEAARAMPRDNGLLAALEKRFVLASCVSFGGIADPFIDPSSGLVFDARMSEDRRFVDFVGDLERRLRGSLSPTRVIAALCKSGSIESSLTFPGLPAAPCEQLVIPAETWFDFEPADEVVAHVMDGKTDAPYLGAGFHDWEPEEGIRWAGPLFSLRLPIPKQDEPVTCRVVVESYDPLVLAGGGVSVFANGVRVKRIESVYPHFREDRALAAEFETRGGSVEVTWVFDESQKLPDSVDDRELSIVVRRFAAYVCSK